jgi:hypothetical protein
VGFHDAECSERKTRPLSSTCIHSQEKYHGFCFYIEFITIDSVRCSRCDDVKRLVYIYIYYPNRSSILKWIMGEFLEDVLSHI